MEKMFEECLLRRVVHGRKLKHGQWRAMEEYEEYFERRMADFAMVWRMKR